MIFEQFAPHLHSTTDQCVGHNSFVKARLGDCIPYGVEFADGPPPIIICCAQYGVTQLTIVKSQEIWKASNANTVPTESLQIKWEARCISPDWATRVRRHGVETVSFRDFDPKRVEGTKLKRSYPSALNAQ